MEGAAAIYQQVLDAVSAAVLAGDAATARPYFCPTWTMRTLAGAFVIDSADKFDEGLLAHSANLRSQGVTDYVRLCRRARFLTPDCIAGEHVTHTLRHATDVVAPYETRMILIRDAGRWKVAEADHDVLNDRWPVHWLHLPDRRPSAARGLADEAQAYLDWISAATLAGDWARYRAGVDLPFHLTSAQGSSTVATEAELRPLFDDFCTWLRTEGVTDYVRIVRAAWALDDGLISAAYDTHVIAKGQRRPLNSPSQIQLRRGRDGQWRSAAIQTRLALSRWGDEAATQEGTLPS